MRLPVCLLAEMSSTENNIPLFNLRNLKEEEKKQKKEVMIYTARGPSVNRGSRHIAQGLLIHLVIPRTLTAGLRDGTMSPRGAPAERRWPRALSDRE